MKAADISDVKIMEIIDSTGKGWASRQMIEDALPEFPPKVVLAKLYQMSHKGRLDGCACGCSGPFSRRSA